MILLNLFYEFFIVGLLSFGGAYSAIPLVRDAALSFNVIDDAMIADFIAISESTPGPIAVNLATFVGLRVAGIKGAIVATIAEVLPAFIIIILFILFFKKYFDNKYVKLVLSVIRPCVIGIIMSVGIYMLYSELKLPIHIGLLGKDKEQIKSIIILVFLLISMYLYRKITKKSIKTINLLILGAIFGIAINYLL